MQAKRSTITLNDESKETFSTLWQLNSPWFEPPNTSRGGWSGVVKTELIVDDEKLNVFIKRQEKHLARSWRHCLGGIPTFQREYVNICRLQTLGIPTLEPVFFERQGKKAILVTKALDDFLSLDKLHRDAFSLEQRKSLLTAIATVTRDMHQSRLQHNCFYPKHIFVSQTAQGWDVKLIDLEKLRRCLFHKSAQLRDISSLSRHADASWSLTDRMRFFKSYVGEKKLSPSSKSLWKKLADKSEKKRR
jgi:hypothetical protein